MSFLQIAVTVTSHSAVGPCLFGLGFILFFVWLVRWGGRIGKERAAALAQVAPAQGLQFSPKGSPEIPVAPAHLIMPYTRRGKFENFFTGQIEQIAVRFFDCTQIRSGPTSLADLMTVTVFRFPGGTIPDFHLEGRNMGDIAAPAVLKHWALTQHGLKTVVPLDFIPTDSATEQTRNLANRYVLLGDNADAVRGFFTPARVSLIESSDTEFYPWNIHASGPWILLALPGGRIEPDAYPAFMARARTLATGLIT
jgi:hypothetical protein